MRFQFISEKVAQFPIRAMCRVVGVSPAGYYAWCCRPVSERARGNARLAVELAHERSRRTYGSPRVATERRAQGHTVSTKRVARIMRENGLRGRKQRRYKATTDSRTTVDFAPNLVARDFRRDAPNQAWVTDVTAISTGAGWLYLAAIIDLFSRAVVAWATSSTNDTELALAALNQAARNRAIRPRLIHHSDRGSPYASHDYRRRLKELSMRPSMSRTGDCWDNAVAESFFATIKGEHLDHEWHPTLASAQRAIADYIDNFYNPLRRHSTIGYLSPDEFELHAQVAKLAA
jgi:putative transposase